MNTKVIFLLSYLVVYAPMFETLKEATVFSVIAIIGYLAYSFSFIWDEQGLCRYALFAHILGIAGVVYTTGNSMLFVPLMALPFALTVADDEIEYDMLKGIVIAVLASAVVCYMTGENQKDATVVTPYVTTVVGLLFLFSYINSTSGKQNSVVSLNKENRELKQKVETLKKQIMVYSETENSDANYLALILGLNFDGFEINEYIEQILNTVKNSMQAIFAGYYTFDKMDKKFKLSSSFGESSLLQTKPIPSGFGSVGTTYETHQYTLIENIQSRTNMSDYEKEQTRGVDNLIAIPFSVKGEVISAVLIGLPKMQDKKVKSTIDILTIMADKVNVELEKMENHKKIEKISITDKLTGLYNRTYFDEKLNILFQNAKNEGSYLTYVLLDLDYFKQMNDTHGHDFGDKVLQTVAKTFKECMRSSDYAFRTGGDEFSLLLLGSDKRSAYGIVKRIADTYAQKVEELHLYAKKDGMDVKSSLSIGISSYPHPNVTTPKELVKRADDAVYYVKEHGKNNIALAK